VVRKLLIGAAVGALAAMVIRELPGLRREIKIWRM